MGIPVTINKKRWSLVFRRLAKNDGECDSPTAPKKQIRISPVVVKDDERYMDTVLHELLHAGCWSLDEEFVSEYARVAAKTLHRLGFRLTDEPGY